MIILLLTEKWIACVPFLTIFCFLRLPGNIVAVDNQVYYALGKSEINLFFEIGLFALNVSVLLIMVRFSIMAIAIGALIVEFLGFFAICIISQVVYGYSLINRFSDLWKATLSSIVMAVSIWSISLLGMKPFPTLIMQFLFGLCIYLLMSYLIRDYNLQYCLSIIKDFLQKRETERSN